MSDSPAFNDSFKWNTYEFLFDSSLEFLYVTEKSEVQTPGKKYQMGWYQNYYYALKDTGLSLSYDPTNGNIVVSNNVDYSHYDSFREYLVEEESATYPSISLFNFEADPGHGHDPVQIVSLRAGGLGIVDVSDTDPVYYKMMSYELNRSQPYGDQAIQIKAVQLTKGPLTRQNTYQGKQETENFNVVCFEVYYEVTS